ncbi:hypothetical protein [Amycolatopsis circi]|uniref:hypothetical protein n=1 Tax=Amycolatopsis circi TaxID=871959 RepID=UPI0013BE93BE|nr:hypothetical protein [Amycolatopsis circi]
MPDVLYRFEQVVSQERGHLLGAEEGLPGFAVVGCCGHDHLRVRLACCRLKVSVSSAGWPAVGLVVAEEFLGAFSQKTLRERVSEDRTLVNEQKRGSCCGWVARRSS